jgi:hypothetical protein
MKRLHENLSTVFMMIGVFAVVLSVVIFAWILLTPDPVPPPPVKDPFPLIAQMPEDIGRLEAEVYSVCKQYASLDLSGMVSLCKRVGFQE